MQNIWYKVPTAMIKNPIKKTTKYSFPLFWNRIIAIAQRENPTIDTIFDIRSFPRKYFFIFIFASNASHHRQQKA